MTLHLASVVAVESRHNAKALSNTAEISTHPRFDLARLRDEYRQACSDLVWAAFEGPSVHAKTLQAQRMTGVPRSKFERILNKETSTPDPCVIAYVLRIYQNKTGRISPAGHLWSQIAGIDQ